MENIKQSILNLYNASRKAPLTADEHIICEQSFNTLKELVDKLEEKSNQKQDSKKQKKEKVTKEEVAKTEPVPAEDLSRPAKRAIKRAEKKEAKKTNKK
jgi:hypothetical protein